MTRYAVYLAPAPESALWRFGSRVLGRDAVTNQSLEPFAADSFTPESWRALTAEPRRYGFHATLKAPFRLKPNHSREELETAIAQLAATTRPFDLGPLQVTALGAAETVFLALTPVRSPPDLTLLETRALTELDAFRAPPTQAEIDRRNPARLTPRQRENLDLWGYPHVLEDFRLHFTLTGPVAPSPTLKASLQSAFAAACPSPNFRVDALTLFVQQPDQDFHLACRFEFG